MHELSIDIETFSSESLKDSGLYKYADSPDFKILLLAYKLDDKETVCIDIEHDEEVPTWLISALCDANYKKSAFNAAFEIYCLNKYFELETPIDQWECTMVKATMVGLPASLESVGTVLNLSVQKDRAGKALIKLFSIPNKLGLQNLGKNYPAQWSAFKQYCIFDVDVEYIIKHKLKWFRISEKERRVWLLDQKINRLGVMLDMQLIEQAISLNDITYERLMARAIELTGLANPNSVKQVKGWFEEQIDDDIESLNKHAIKNLKKEYTDSIVQEMFDIRLAMSRSAVKKYKAMKNFCGYMNRARGMFVYNGANKTGRWSSRGVQLHNLAKNKFKDIGLARELLREGNFEDLELLFGNSSEILSQLVRPAFIPSPSHIFLISDFSAIEARVLAWIAGEEWRLEVFRGDGKIYEASGAQMFKVPIEEIVGDLRFKSKTAELALGFQGGVGAINRMESMGLHTGLTEEEKPIIVNRWRKVNKKIVQFWYDVNEAAIEAVQNPGIKVKLGFVTFIYKGNTLFLQLPSGRLLTYNDASIRINSYGYTCVSFYGVDQETKKWSRQTTYGGKLTENIVQGTARDVLAEAMLRVDQAEFKIPMHVHDEIITEVLIEEAEQKLKEIDKIMAQPISWAPGLPLVAKSFLSPYYVKDQS